MWLVLYLLLYWRQSITDVLFVPSETLCGVIWCYLLTLRWRIDQLVSLDLWSYMSHVTSLVLHVVLSVSELWRIERKDYSNWMLNTQTRLILWHFYFFTPPFLFLCWFNFHPDVWDPMPCLTARTTDLGRVSHTPNTSKGHVTRVLAVSFAA